MILKILGTPFPKQSFRYSIRGKGKKKQFVHKYQTTEIKNKEANVTAQVVAMLPKWFVPFSGKVRINKAHFIYPPLKSFSKKKIEFIKNGGILYKTTTPDLADNLMKGLLDAMKGVVFLDDKQICIVNDSKKYYGFTPMTIIDIEEFE